MTPYVIFEIEMGEIRSSAWAALLLTTAGSVLGVVAIESMQLVALFFALLCYGVGCMQIAHITSVLGRCRRESRITRTEPTRTTWD